MIALRAAVTLLALAAVVTFTGVVALGLDAALVVVAPFVGWALIAGVIIGLGSAPVCWGLGRYLDHRERLAALTAECYLARLALLQPGREPTALTVINGTWRDGG